MGCLHREAENAKAEKGETLMPHLKASLLWDSVWSLQYVDCVAPSDRITDECWIVKDMKGSGPNLIWATIPAFPYSQSMIIFPTPQCK
jgi:hypothetical protein